MEVKIQIDETRFGELLDKELEAFSKEELHDFIAEAIKQYLVDTSFVKKFFVETRVNRNSWSSREEEVPTQLLSEAVKNLDWGPALSEIQEVFTKVLKEQTTEIIVSLMANSIANAFSAQITAGEEFKKIIFNNVTIPVNKALLEFKTENRL